MICRYSPCTHAREMLNLLSRIDLHNRGTPVTRQRPRRLHAGERVSASEVSQ
jgi:hypothetical protein